MSIETVFIRPAQLVGTMQKLEVAGLHDVYITKVKRTPASNTGTSRGDGLPTLQKWLRLDVVAPSGSLNAIFEGSLRAGSWPEVPAKIERVPLEPAVARKSFIPPFSI